MKNKSLKELNNKKHSIEQASNAQLDKYQGTNLFIPQTKVTLNWFVFSLFSLSLFSFGAMWSTYNSTPSVDLSNIELRQEQIIELLAQQDSMINQIRKPTTIIKSDPNLVKLTGEEFKRIIKAKGLGNQITLLEQQKEIEGLKNKLRLMAEIRPELGRRPTSKKTSQSIPYNKKNASVLWYEQQLEQKEYFGRLKEEKKDFLLNNDISNPQILSKFNKLKKDHKLAIFELTAQHEQERLAFIKKKYRVRY